MTWCVLVFLCMWGFEPGTFRKSDFGKEGMGDPDELQTLREVCLLASQMTSLQNGPQESPSLWALKTHAE